MRSTLRGSGSIARSASFTMAQSPRVRIAGRMSLLVPALGRHKAALGALVGRPLSCLSSPVSNIDAYPFNVLFGQDATVHGDVARFLES